MKHNGNYVQISLRFNGSSNKGTANLVYRESLVELKFYIIAEDQGEYIH